MTALKIIGIILLIFLLLGFLRVGADVSFGDRLAVRLRIGAIRLTIFPKKRKKKPGKEAKKEENAQPAEEKPKKEKKKRALPKLTLGEILDLVDTALSALGATLKRTCKRVRIDPLEATVVLGGLDPASLSMTYGALSAAMFSVMPKAEERFYIPDPSLHLRVDFEADQPTAEGFVCLTMRVCDFFAIGFTLLIPLLKWSLRFKKAHRHDAQGHRHPDPDAKREDGDQNTDQAKDREEQIA